MYKRRLRLVLKSKLNGKNKITINAWAVAVSSYHIHIQNRPTDTVRPAK